MLENKDMFSSKGNTLVVLNCAAILIYDISNKVSACHITICYMYIVHIIFLTSYYIISGFWYLVVPL